MAFECLAGVKNIKTDNVPSQPINEIDRFDFHRDIDKFAKGFDFRRTSGHLIRMVRERSMAAYILVTDDEDISVQQLKVLVALHQKGPVIQTELGEASGIDRSTIAEMIHRMVKRGLINRRTPKTNRRARILSITPAGRSAMRRLLPKLLEANEMALSPLDEMQRSTFFTLLKMLCDAPLSHLQSKEKKRPEKR